VVLEWELHHQYVESIKPDGRDSAAGSSTSTTPDADDDSVVSSTLNTPEPDVFFTVHEDEIAANLSICSSSTTAFSNKKPPIHFPRLFHDCGLLQKEVGEGTISTPTDCQILNKKYQKIYQ
jgi:hypothetical protein